LNTAAFVVAIHATITDLFQAMAKLISATFAVSLFPCRRERTL
jgi:hypothetical protein